jgi:hypothetical protein
VAFVVLYDAVSAYDRAVPAGDADDLRRQFDALISGAELGDLRKLADQLSVLSGSVSAKRTSNPHLRHPKRDEPAIFRVRVDLNDAHPPIWRRLDLRSDLTLAAVHQVLQAAYDWTDSHLHRFSIGGDTFDMAAEWFLCEYDVEEGEDEGTPDADVTLDETLVEPGDVLHYVYDYGDSWDLTICLQEVLPLTNDAPRARCVEGQRAAPPDDCGGLRDAEDLAHIVGEPAAFDVGELNERLVSPAGGIADWGVRPDLVLLLNHLQRTPVGDDFIAPHPRHRDSRATRHRDTEGQPSRVPVVPRSRSRRRHHADWSRLSQARRRRGRVGGCSRGRGLDWQAQP